MTERLRFETYTAIRSLLATPVPVAGAIATLAVAVGLNVAMFGLIDRALLSPPAHVVNPGAVITLSFRPPGESNGSAGMTTVPYATFRVLREEVAAFEDVAAWQRAPGTVMSGGEQLRVDAMIVSGSYFRLLGTSPLIGRALLPDDDHIGAAAPIAVLSHAFWSSAFGGDRDIVGRPMTVRGLPYTIGGVMPPDFTGHSTTRVDVWVPFAGAMRNVPGWEHDRYRNTTSIVARLAPGANASAATTQASAVLDRAVLAAPIHGSEVSATERRIAWWLAAISTLVLIVGLANAGTLLLVRAARRRQEMAVRTSLGATRSRLLLHAWIEAVMLAVVATGLSLLLTYWLDDAVRGWLFPALSGKGSPDRATLLATGIAGVLTAITAGAANGWQIQTFSRRDATSHVLSRRRLSLTTLLLVQTTMSVVLLAGLGMFGGSFYRLAAQDFGMRMHDVLVVDTEAGPETGPGPRQLYADALDRVRALPGVEIATIIDALPFNGFHVPPISVPGHDEPPNTGGQLPNLIAATPELFRILDIPIVDGRSFTNADAHGPFVVIVNQAMAQQVWPGERAVGKCIRIGHNPGFNPALDGPEFAGPSEAVPCRDVIGVARDVRQRSVVPNDGEERLMQYYVPFEQVPLPPFPGAGPVAPRGLLLRARVSPEALAPSIRRIVVGDRADLPFVRVQRYERFLDRQLRPWRLGTTLLVMFSAVALGVAALGLYAAFMHAVNERRREMAIRLAVGADPGRLARRVIGDALSIGGVGILFGWVAAIGAGRSVEALLFQTAPSDPLVLGFAALVMLIVSVAATVAPARAASRHDPSALLRAE